MAKLADEILKGLASAPWVGPHNTDDRTRVALQRAADYARKIITYDPVIDVSNVADFVWDTKETWSTTDKDQFPCLTPPFPSFFMEYKRPAHFLHERDDLQTEEGKKKFGAVRQGRSNWVRADTSGWPIDRYGVLFDSIDLGAGQTFDDFPIHLGDDKGTDLIKANVHPNSRWVLRGSLFIKQRDEKRPNGPVAYWFGGLDEHGVLLQDAVIGFPAANVMDADEKFYWQTMLRPTFIPALRAISYMHCKNIEQQTVTPPPKLSKAYAKKNGRPLLKFRTLVIQPLAAGGKKVGGPGGGGAKSHHFRRGHFGDYREKGLFGRENMKRIFWFDMTMVGSKEVGEVIGDYAVKAPKEEAS